MAAEDFITIAQLADYRLGRKAENGQDFEDAGLPIMGGCSVCGASIAAYNAYPAKDGYLKCHDHIEGVGWYSVENADEDIFGDEE